MQNFKRIGSDISRPSYLMLLFEYVDLQVEVEPIKPDYKFKIEKPYSLLGKLILLQGCHGTGKTGNLKSIFPDRENTGNLLKNIKNMFLHREFTTNTGKILKVKKNNELGI